MSESGQTEQPPDVQDDKTVTQSAKEEDTDVKETKKPLKIVENDVRDTKDDTNSDMRPGDDEVDADGDSEAETLIQSPEKKRNSVADASTVVHQLKAGGSDTGSIVLANSPSDKENAIRKRKRPQEGARRDSPSPPSSHHSSPLSSPVPHLHSDADSDTNSLSGTRSSPRKRRGSNENDKLDLPKKRRRRPSEIIPPHSAHKRSKRGSIDATERRETRSATYPRPSEDEKSQSPEPVTRREHRRGVSTQLTVGEFEKKKRGRPPLISTRRNRSADRASDTSSESEPRTGRPRPPLHKLASNDHDTMSPAKSGPRKWRDKNGRTHLARACANNDLEGARAKLIERPEDLNMSDNAGNTPLQIASLEGFENIVEFLLVKGADVNVRNVDKDTPLIDAVENGHIEVIELLLKHGANPRMGNAKGDEPYELVHPDDDSYQLIRKMLAEAKDKDATKTQGVDANEPPNRDGVSSRAASAASPRDSPPIGVPRSPPAFGSRRRTGRSESTRNDLLWQASTQENLAKLASKGDVQGVANILSILEKAETESLIAAAKAGHEEVLQLLIAMGKPNPDPDPVRSTKMMLGHNTPMLAAIGRGHPDVVKLLANQSGFNVTRKYRDKTYFELADERRGNRWEEEYDILKAAYDRAKGKKSSSPRKTRETEKAKPQRRSSSVSGAKGEMLSPTATHRSLPTKGSEHSPRQSRKVSDSISETRKSIGDTEASLAVASDADQTVNAPKKGHRTRRSQSDLPPVFALESEPSQKRRRLVTGKEHRSRHTLSNSSDNDDPNVNEVKQEDRPQSALKRSRVSSTPEPPSEAKDRKKRRTVLESSPELARAVPIQTAEAVQSDEQTEASTKQPESTGASDTEKLAALETDTSEIPPNSSDKVKHESPEPKDAPAVELDTLPDAGQESGDDYSPPPAEEPPEEEKVDTHDEEEAKAEAEKREAEKQEAEKRAAEEAARQEAERQAKEQAEKEAKERAAEEARLKQEADAKKKEEEEQRKRKQEEERQERLKQELELRRRQEQLEKEQRRREALPIVLARTAQLIDEDQGEARSPQWLNRFLPLYTVKTRQLDPGCGASVADDEWVPNFQVACLLAIKDLTLLNFTSFDKRPVSTHERHCLWRVARLKLSYDFNPVWGTSVRQATELEDIAQAKFMAMTELFWVKLSDFLDQVTRFPHLTNVTLPRQSISLKSYTEILGARFKTGVHLQQQNSLPNGITPHINGENGVL